MFFSGVATAMWPLLMQAALIKLNESFKKDMGVGGDLLGTRSPSGKGLRRWLSA